jgi:hypothetical protein
VSRGGFQKLITPTAEPTYNNDRVKRLLPLETVLLNHVIEVQSDLDIYSVANPDGDVVIVLVTATVARFIEGNEYAVWPKSAWHVGLGLSLLKLGDPTTVVADGSHSAIQLRRAWEAGLGSSLPKVRKPTIVGKMIHMVQLEYPQKENGKHGRVELGPGPLKVAVPHE